MITGRNNREQEVVAVLPAAGRSIRLAPIPCSKELLPIGFGPIPGRPGKRPKVASHYLLECLRQAGVQKCYLVIRQGKWDIPSYWGDGSMLGMDLAYVVIDGSCGPPDTIDRAFAFVEDKVVAFGFPDILFRPKDIFSKLLDQLARRKADVVLGLFPAHDTRAMDMIALDADHRVRAVHLKPRKTRLKYAWLCAVWTPVFTKFLHDFLAARRRSGRGLGGNRRIDPQGDIPVGVVFQAAIHAGLHIEGVTVPTGRYIDIGTPEALTQASRTFP